ncbi:MAG: hypothetical protein AAF391_04235 [Bacteroidota bacterium]
MKALFKRIFVILKRGDLLVFVPTIIGAVVIVFLGIFGADNERWFNEIFLGICVLVLVYLHLFLIRLNKHGELLNSKVSSDNMIRLLNRDKRRIKTEDQVAQAKKSVWLVAECPSKILNTQNRNSILRKIQGGCEFKFILGNPQNIEINQIYYSNPAYTKAPYRLKAAIEEAIETYLFIREQLVEDGRGFLMDKIQLKMWNGPFTHGLLLTDYDLDDFDTCSGLCRIEMRLFDIVKDERPNFYLKREYDRFWFEKFVKEFKQHWSHLDDEDDKKLRDLLKSK